MIHTSEKIDKLMGEMFDLYYDSDILQYDLVDALGNKAFCVLYDDSELHDVSFEKGVELGEAAIKQRKPIYKSAIGDDEIYYFLGDLNRDILPMLKVELKKLKRACEEEEKMIEEENVQRLDIELAAAEKRVSELKKEKAAKSNKGMHQ